MSRLPLVRRALQSGVMTRDALALFRDAGWDESQHQRGPGGKFGTAAKAGEHQHYHEKMAKFHSSHSERHAGDGDYEKAKQHIGAASSHRKAARGFAAAHATLREGDFPQEGAKQYHAAHRQGTVAHRMSEKLQMAPRALASRPA